MKGEGGEEGDLLDVVPVQLHAPLGPGAGGQHGAAELVGLAVDDPRGLPDLVAHLLDRTGEGVCIDMPLQLGPQVVVAGGEVRGF